MSPRTLGFWTVLALWPVGLEAQLIQIRTVPVTQSHQFDLFPSQTLGMGGISIAVPDTLLDPFRNPATGTRLRASRLDGSLGMYGVSSGSGAGRAFPLGLMVKQGRWFGGVTLALQEVDLSRQSTFVSINPGTCPACRSSGIDPGPVEQSHGNTYAHAVVGRDLPGLGLSIGGSVFWSQLHAIDGVDLLYAGAGRIKQYGNALDLRVGMLKEWTVGRSLEATVLHSRLAMTHDVFYLDPFWDPGSQQFAQRPRFEPNLDRTTTWGLHVEYEHPLSVDGWRVGWLGTVNLMSHPKIPNYEIMNIPRDPGHSSAFNIGFGIARTRAESATLGIDLIYEPIWSYTWADAEVPVVSSDGVTIPAGGKTIENRFRFSNALVRVGIEQDLEFAGLDQGLGLQLGLAVRSIHYRLDQQDNVQRSARRLDEDWVEWMPTWGLAFRFTGLELRYRGQVTSGTGRPGVIPDGGIALPEDALVGSNVLVAPSGPVTLTEVTVVTHRISFSLPLH